MFQEINFSPDRRGIRKITLWHYGFSNEKPEFSVANNDWNYLGRKVTETNIVFTQPYFLSFCRSNLCTRCRVKCRNV